MRPWILAAALAAGLCAVGSGWAQSLPGPAFPVFETPQALAAQCERALGQARDRLRQLERRKPDAGWLAAYDAFSGLLEDIGYPAQFLSAVHPDKPIRDASEACELKWQDFQSTLGQNPILFKALRAAKPRDAIDRELRRVSIESFEDAGVGLSPQRRERAKVINDRMTAAAQAFDRNIRDEAVQVQFTEAELKGVPANVWKDAPRESDGRVRLGLDYPTYSPVMQGAEVAAARERMWRAKVNEGGERNLRLLAEIAALRREYAQLFGLPSYADFVLRRRMAGSTAKAHAFLDAVKATVRDRELREIEQLRQAKAAHLGVSAAGLTLDRWDVAFYSERLRREQYAVDQDAFRPYFPPQESLAFTLRLVERLMGVRYQRVDGVKLWHPEVQAYAVADAATGRPLATMYVDLYSREGKYNHAAVWSLRGGSTRTARLPQAALVVNFDRKGLTLDEMETLLHELGHAVHNNLSLTRWTQHAGTSVQRDFVEAPSQMLEDWVYRREVLDLFKEVCPACNPVPDDLLRKAERARHFGKGVQQARQHLYAAYDLALYDTQGRDAMALWADMEGATPLGHVKGTMFPAGFSHIASNYGAGYYGYLWSLVVATDLRTAFTDRLDPRVGRRYRDIVLGAGSQRPPKDIVRDFLGREFTTRAFFDDLAR
ncbi:MAG: M3 family metallopeptidase [Aquabacterium sp.]